MARRYPISKHITIFFASWGVAFVVFVLRWTCRVRVHNDPRPGLKAAKKHYIFSVLHAHQVSAIVNAERGTGAMVSQSLDGQIIVPSLRISGVIPVRGSGGKGRGTGRGGKEALDKLIAHVEGGRPAYLAVDGPRGPRGHVHKGVAVMARCCDAAILLMIAVPTKRWTLKRSWDRLQIPRPFCRIDGYFADPIWPATNETAEQLRLRIEQALYQLELKYDPAEAQYWPGKTTANEPALAQAAVDQPASEPVCIDEAESKLAHES